MRSPSSSADWIDPQSGKRLEGPVSLVEGAAQAPSSFAPNKAATRRIATAPGDHEGLLGQGDHAKPPVYIEPRSTDALLPGGLTLAQLGEHYEALKASVWVRSPEWDMKMLVFVGATAGCGVSTAAACFAEALASDSKSNVLLIDANLRSEREQAAGFEREEVGTSFWSAISGAKGPLVPLPGLGNLYVLPRGPAFPRPSLLFQSAAFDEFLRNAKQRFDHVVFDAPPLRGHPESLVLSRWADGVILVVEAERTRKRTALWARQQIETAGGNLLGVVLNKRRFHIPDWLYRML